MGGAVENTTCEGWSWFKSRWTRIVRFYVKKYATALTDTTRLHSEVSMMDLGNLHQFLCISVTHDSLRLFLLQCQYAVDLL